MKLIDKPMIVANSKEELLEENKAYVLFERQGEFYSIAEECELTANYTELKKWSFAKEPLKYESIEDIANWSKSNKALNMAVRFNGSVWFNPARYDYQKELEKYEVASVYTISKTGFIEVCSGTIQKFTKGFLDGRN